LRPKHEPAPPPERAELERIVSAAL
jgi:hypothetical protein